MPVETQTAVNWALSQTVVSDGFETLVTKDDPHLLVDKVREYFNEHEIEYSTFSYEDLLSYLGE